jgi:hypothetical protein
MLGNGSVDGCDGIACKDGGNFCVYQRGCPHWFLVAEVNSMLVTRSNRPTKYMPVLGHQPEAEDTMDLEDRKTIQRLLPLSVIT